MRYIYFLLLLGTFICCSNKTKSSEEKKIDAIHSITNCSKLYTIQYNTHKIIIYEDLSNLESSIFTNLSIKIPGDRKIAIPLNATIKAYIDFSKISENDFYILDDNITVTLPNPIVELTFAEIDYENEKVITSWNRSNFTEKEKESLLKQAKNNLLNNIKNTDIIERSQVSAYNTLLPIFENIGYKKENITIKFDDNVKVIKELY